MHRILVAPQAIQGDTITVTDPRERHHLVTVLRVTAGDPVECLDGEGGRYRGTVLRCTRKEIVIHIDERQRDEGSELQVTLAQALIKPERFEWAIQKATELGVRRIIPLLTARTVSRLTTERAHAKLNRWQRIVREAAKQCGRPMIPTLESPTSLSQFLQSSDRSELLLMPTLAVEASPLGGVLMKHRALRAVTVLIGPEGDFTPEEVLQAQRRGAEAVSLGPVTLRAETAALTILSILHYTHGALAHRDEHEDVSQRSSRRASE
ncbi:MAG: 16S rRNA (uracil(1498)-N(3))-methyltransferase [Candidatus Omnitrophica bacterium]|nr:16S rRNA (uracil(1498)-N(3))-methyltransferase [Candidatus Omnitrophota bacterium]